MSLNFFTPCVAIVTPCTTGITPNTRKSKMKTVEQSQERKHVIAENTVGTTRVFYIQKHCRCQPCLVKKQQECNVREEEECSEESGCESDCADADTDSDQAYWDTQERLRLLRIKKMNEYVDSDEDSDNY